MGLVGRGLVDRRLVGGRLGVVAGHVVLVVVVVVLDLFALHQVVEVDRRPGGVGDVALSSTAASALRRADLLHDRGDLALLVDGLGELVGVHAVLLGAHHEVLDELGLLDPDLELLGDGVEEELGLERLAGALVDLGAVLVVVEAVLALEVLVHLGLDDAVGHGHVDGLEQVLEHLVAGLDALLVPLGLLGLGGDVGAQLVEGVELGGELGEVVVERRAARGP